MKVEIWSDVVCPWCYIGKRRLEAALARFPRRTAVDISWRAFELDPAAPRELPGALVDHLAGKYGVPREQAQAMQDSMTARAAEEGLDFRFDRARSGNTLDAHRLLHLAAEHGMQDAVKERLLAAYLTDGEPIGDVATLVRLGAQAGLDDGEAREVLESGRFTAEVRADEREAAALGVTGVPFFVVDRRYAVSGAQPAEVLLDVLERAWADAHPLTLVGGGAGGSCADGIGAV